MRLPRYCEYRDSGERWLGTVPAHWQVERLKNLFEIRKRIAGEEGHQVLSITQRGIKVKDIESNDGQLSMDYSKYQIVHPGDFAMNHMDLLTGFVDISAYAGVTSPDYRVFGVRDGVKCDPRYFLYLLQNGYRQKVFYAFGQGASELGRWRFPTDQFNDFRFPCPSRKEQTTIATFLDHETAKIDTLIAEQEKLIDLLAEKRQATISHAVTRGLHPNAPMKDSGVAWLGEVPAHWETGALKRYWSVTDCKHVTAEFVDEGYPLASIREAQSKYVALEGAKCTTQAFYELLTDGGRKPIPGDLIFSRNATVGEVAQVHVDHPLFALGQDVCLLRPLRAGDSSDFMQAVLRSGVVVEQLKSIMVGSTFKRVNVEEIRSLQVPMPPPDEREKIAEYIGVKVKDVDLLDAEARRVIDLLKERRSAMIAAAVTGQIDVRGAANA